MLERTTAPIQVAGAALAVVTDAHLLQDAGMAKVTPASIGIRR